MHAVLVAGRVSCGLRDPDDSSCCHKLLYKVVCNNAFLIPISETAHLVCSSHPPQEEKLLLGFLV